MKAMIGYIERTLVYAIFVFCIINSEVFSQKRENSKEPKIPLTKATAPAEISGATKERSALAEKAAPLRDTFSLLVSYSLSQFLKGYEDPLYVDSDKTDYMKSDMHTVNIEFFMRNKLKLMNLDELFGKVHYTRIGGQLLGAVRPQAKSVNIPAAKAPLNTKAVNETLTNQNLPGLGFFIGIEGDGFIADAGLAMLVEIQNERTRTRRKIDANGNPILDANGNVATEEVEGRGPFPSTVFVLPTFYLSLGDVNNLQFVFSILRENFDYSRDMIQMYLRIPAGNFTFDIGTGLYPAATFFVQPNVKFSSVTLSLRSGIGLNFYDDNLRRVALSDSLYGNVMVSVGF